MIKEITMTDEDLNKRIHEIVGLCWHKCKLDNPKYEKLSHYKCEKCGLGYIINRNLVNTWEGFGILWEFMQKHEQIEEFITKYGSYAAHPIKPPYVYCLPII